MKKTASFLSTATLVAVVALILTFFSCQKSQPANAGNEASANGATAVDKSTGTKISGAPMKVNSILLPIKLADEHGMPPVGDATLIFNSVGGAPVTAPDGHQLTLGEFNMASGWADVNCNNTGTHVVIHLTGLIPNGVYTIWNIPMQSPGFDGTLANTIGVGALGAPDGSQNTFTGGADGTASLSVIVQGGNLSAFGTIGSCFSSSFEVLLATAYHPDGMTHGGVPGDEATWVFQNAFPIMGSKF